MTELKTLKDFGRTLSYTNIDTGKPAGTKKHYADEELRQEAIKWVKTPEWGYEIISKFIDLQKPYDASFEVYFKERKALELWIKHFFNLTEEDLK